ncbi:MAG: amidase family protein [Hyphomicrobiales bacterium]|nr:amidase family protein [Hyphomicrobiales bacterium]
MTGIDDVTTSDGFPLDDTVGAFVPHGRFVVSGAPEGPLAGLTFAVKDLFDVAGHPTGAGNPSRLATHDAPTKNAPLVDTLLAAGATLTGKTITDELAYSLHGDNLHYGAPINAAAPDRVTGGSSSGSAAAVAARLVDFAIGTDTGGSTRVPASYCNIWGLRTTHGLLPSEGAVPLHLMFDCPTWFAADADVFERVGRVLAPESAYAPKRLLLLDDACELADLDFAFPLAAVLATLQDSMGASLQRLRASEGSSLEAWRGVYMTAGAHEGWQLHGDWISAADRGFAPAIAGRWRAASQVSDEAGAQARADMVRIRAHVRELLGDDGVAVLPSAASFAPRRDADPADVDATRMRTMAITCIAGLAGLPQVNIPFAAPCGTPLGVSLLGPAGSDLALIRLAIGIRRALDQTLEHSA